MRILIMLGTICCLLVTPIASAQPIKHQITGLFMPERERDLREVCDKLADIKLVSINYKNAEATFDYVPAKLFPKQTPEQIVQKLDNLLRSASNSTFGVKPRCALPADKLTFVEIPAGGLDCKACCLTAYEAIYKIDGVERATANFRDGKITAWIDSRKTDRPTLETALKNRGVTIGKR